LFQYRDFRAGGFYWTPDTEEIRVSIFGLFQKKVDKTTLQLSSRLEHLSVDPETSFLFMSNLDERKIRKREFTIFTGSAGLFRTWDNLDISLATMIAGRAPDLDELYSDGPHLGTYSYEIGQPDLDLERTVGIEGSVDYRMIKGQIKLTGYYNYSPNYHISTALGNRYEPGADWIEWGSGSTGWLYKYQMKGLEAQIFGWESDIMLPINKTINLVGSASVVRGKNLSQDRDLEYMPPDKIQLLTEFNFKALDVGLNMKKVFPQTRLGEFETKTEGFSLLDLHASYTMYSSKITHKLVVQLDNVFNEVYYNHLSRIKSIMPEEERCLSIQYRFIF
jgi:iron complex outermembrane receptor protein